MTAQVPHRVIFDGTFFDLCGISGTGMFDPEEHGIHPTSTNTAVASGFLCIYGVRDDTLYLEILESSPQLIQTGNSQKQVLGAKDVFGVEPQKGGSLGYIYGPLGFPVPLTGKILLGNDFIQDLYIHMGFQDAHKYEKVVELFFENGHLVNTVDRSDEMAAVREQKMANGGDTEMGSTDWIEKSFSLDYD